MSADSKGKKVDRYFLQALYNRDNIKYNTHNVKLKYFIIVA